MYPRTLILLLAATLAQAALQPVPEGTQLPAPLKEVGIDQKLNSQLPLDAVFTDARGETRPLGQFLRGRPTVLAFVFYECPMLCNMVLNGLLRSIRPLPLDVGKDFDVVAISFDPVETPAQAEKKRREYVERYNRAGGEQGWRFLVGDEVNIKRVTGAAGFRFTRDPQTGQWAHASGIMVVTPDGRLARYFYGVEFSSRDLRLALVEASRGKIGTAVDQVMLYCFHYDPITGKYGLLVMKLLRLGGGLTLGALLAFWFVSYRRGRRKKLDHANSLPVIS